METTPDQRAHDEGRRPQSAGPISVVVPVYDEEPNIEALAEAISTALDDAGIEFEAILVDDGSTDGSSKLLDEVHAADPRFKIVHFARNYGQTAALSAGFAHAGHDVVVTVDADLQNDPRDIPELLALIDEGYDLVCGWRKDRQDRWLDRKLPSLIANGLISWLSKVHLHDYGCTLKAYRREFLDELPLYGEMHRFIPIYMVWAGARLVEVPVRHHARRAGKTKYGLLRTFKVLLDLVTIKFLRDFYVNPIYFFGYFGFASIFAGFVAAAAAVYMKFEYGTWMHKNPLVIISTMCVLLGFNAFFFGVLAEILIRMNFEIQGKKPYKVRRIVGELIDPGDGDEPD